MSKIDIPRAVYTVREVAAALALSTRTIDRMIARGELRAVRLGRNVRIAVAELERVTGGARLPEHRKRFRSWQST